MEQPDPRQQEILFVDESIQYDIYLLKRMLE